MPVLGFDIDGVITAEGQGENNIWYKNLKEYFGEDFKKIKNTYDFAEAFNLSAAELDEFMTENLARIYSSVPPSLEARNTLEELKKQENRIVLITARDEKFREITENWLARNDFIFDKLYHTDNKGFLAAREEIKVFVDDHKENASDLMNNNIPVLLYTRYHNLDATSDMYYKRVEDWEEINRIIKKEFLS